MIKIKHIIFALLIVTILNSLSFAGDRDFFNSSDRKIIIYINGLKCDYPKNFINCKVENDIQLKLILPPDSNKHASYNHYLIGKLTIVDYESQKELYSEQLVDEKENPTLNKFNTCMSITIKKISNKKVEFNFDGCLFED